MEVGRLGPIGRDNRGCVGIAGNPKLQGRAEQVNVKYHYTCDLVNNNDIALSCVPTGDQMADVLTEPTSQFVGLGVQWGLK